MKFRQKEKLNKNKIWSLKVQYILQQNPNWSVHLPPKVAIPQAPTISNACIIRVTKENPKENPNIRLGHIIHHANSLLTFVN